MRAIFSVLEAAGAAVVAVGVGLTFGFGPALIAGGAYVAAVGFQRGGEGE